MSTTPLVSIVIHVSNGQERIDDALHSCASQSLSEIEIICIDSSPAAGNTILAQAAVADPRVRVICQPSGTSPPEARRVGVLAATAPYILFLEADDELDSEAAEVVYTRASDSNADIAGFGVTVVEAGGQVDAVTQGRLRPKHAILQDEDILRQLFPEDTAVDGQVWRYLYRTVLLRAVYAALPGESASDLADDLPIIFLACAAANTYASLATPLYRHHLAGDSDRRPANSIAKFRRAVDSIGSLAIIEPIVREWARNSHNPEPLVDGYESVRLAMIGIALDLWQGIPDDLQGEEAVRLRTRASEIDIVVAAATFAPTALQALAQRGDRVELGQKRVRSVLLTTNVLTTGGVTGVLLTQAQVLLGAGYRVTIATHRPGSNESLVPDGAALVQISGSTRRHRLFEWDEVCRRNEIDVVIDHRILYSRDWPGYALAARASQAATIGWIHNFAGRPTYNGNDLHSLLQSNLNALAQLIVLSPLDVAFWKLRGIHHVAYLPNPPSPLLLRSAGRVAPKIAPTGRRLEIVWWGRLEEHTKKVTQLVEVAAALKRLGVDFRLRIIGPDWTDMTATRLIALVSKRGVDGLVEVTGPRHGQELLDAIDSSDIFINTSIIEGYPLTVPEAQSRGLPVVMYDLPWLTLVQNNPGVIAVPQGAVDALAGAISELATDPARFEALSRASIEAAERATEFDFALLYQHLVTGTLPAELSPEPTLEDGRKALNLLIFFAEKSVRAMTPSSKPSSSKPSSSKPSSSKPSSSKPGHEPRVAASGGTRGRTSPRSLGARVERKLTGPGHRVLDLAPWLRPVARQIKRALLRL